MMDIRRLEEVALNAWPALSQVFYDGWVLRFSEGYTKRGNSANALAESTIDVSEKIEYCQQAYARKKLPAIFRISPLALPELDRELEARGYAFFHPTWVMTLDLQLWEPPSGENQISESALEEWIDVFSLLSESQAGKQSTHLKILESIETPCLWALSKDQNDWVSGGLGVLDDRYFGLFDIVTHPEKRNQGFGTQLIAGMLKWAKDRGAETGYLQVMDENKPARQLYKKLGYRDVYKYWYRVPG